MNRDAFLIYLKDLRDLEFARESLDTALARGKDNYNRRANFLRQTNYRDKEKFDWLFIIIAPILVVAFVFVFRKARSCTFFPDEHFLSGTLEALFWYAFVLVLGYFTILCVFVAITSLFGTPADNRAIRKHNQQEAITEENHKKELATLNATWNKQSASLKRQYNQVDTLLKNGYNLNLIPSPYRNLASLYYIYDYMSTSQASLEDTLLHEHLENGIQRILSRLNSIIAQNEQIIFQNRQLEAQNRQMIERTDWMLASLQRTEQNTLEGKQYAQISAQHTQTIAVFKEMEFWDNYSKRR